MPVERCAVRARLACVISSEKNDFFLKFLCEPPLSCLCAGCWLVLLCVLRLLYKYLNVCMILPKKKVAALFVVPWGGVGSDRSSPSVVIVSVVAPLCGGRWAFGRVWRG